MTFLLRGYAVDYAHNLVHSAVFKDELGTRVLLL